MDSTAHSGKFHVFLVKPSKYDDEGYVIRHWRGVLPSNTLACLYGLTDDLRRRRALGAMDVRIHMLDEAVDKVNVARIARLNRRERERAVVCLVGVQSNQFCRASDLALELRGKGVPVLIGGFHVSGVLAMFPDVSPEIQTLLDHDVSVVAGEIEDRWEEILKDAYHDRLQPIYRLLAELPDLSGAPLPVVHRKYLKKFISPNFGTIDCSRGCPFNCSFCTIINVQGRKSRHRSPDCIAETLRHNYRHSGINFYFFTDDDFARNPAWSEIFDRLIELREVDGVPVDFMMQVDVQSFKIPEFVEKASRAGCSNVFIGMESINPRNLKDAGKTQNKTKEYRDLIDTWHRHRVSTHVGYIVGFPGDTEESVREDVEVLMKSVRPHRASFFMMTPLPGSQDHKHMVDAGTALSSDYNLYDSFHETMDHPNMHDGGWTRSYVEAWRSFYSFEHMKAVLESADPDNYWDILRNFYWYKNSALNEGSHPMLTGFFRLRDRTSRRPGFAREGRLAHARRRIPEIFRYLRDALRLTLEMEELWLQTRKRSEAETRVIEELARIRTELHRSLKISELRCAYSRARASLPRIEIPSRLTLLKDKLTILGVSRLRESRRDLAVFWSGLHERLRRGRVEVLLRVDRLALNFLREIRVLAGFVVALVTAPRYEPRGN